jgi:hypothetical protein
MSADAPAQAQTAMVPSNSPLHPTDQACSPSGLARLPAGERHVRQAMRHPAKFNRMKSEQEASR